MSTLQISHFQLQMKSVNLKEVGERGINGREDPTDKIQMQDLLILNIDSDITVLNLIFNNI